MNAVVIHFPKEIKRDAASASEAPRPMRDDFGPQGTVHLELPAQLADRIKVAAGYACKSPGQWTHEALSALLDMDLAI
jgi:hypothetical protein